MNKQKFYILVVGVILLITVESLLSYSLISKKVFDDVYLALNTSEFLKYILEVESNYDEVVTVKSNDENVAIITDNLEIVGVGIGKTTIELKVKEEVRNLNVTVTDLINKMSESFNRNKKRLPCNKYTKDDNDLLDAILFDRISDAGYKTRAGVVAAARFMTLEFPYKVDYFSENGRLNTYGNTHYVDGEGRYYHRGLYLHSSRYSNLKKSMYGPNIWGCNIFSYVAVGTRRNGLDCSGYISWILVNGGFDPGDIGAGISNVLDFTDLGNKIAINTSLQNNSMKVGDLLSGPYNNGGHIAMLIGTKDGKYYVTESLWSNTEYGVLVKTYTKDNIYNYFKWHIDMDSYYINDGNYTEFWL